MPPPPADRLPAINGGFPTNGNRYGAPHSDTDGSSTCSSLNRRTLKPPSYTFILPSFSQWPEDFRRHMERELIEIATLKRLEASGHLNWWCTHANQRLWPLLTTGDGNCLLHATSLAIWGVHDRQLNLRQLLHDSLTVSERRAAFYRRWRYQESKSNLQSQLVLTEDEWQKEWETISGLASLTPRVIGTENGNGHRSSNDQIYESLETLHVYALSNVLKRPIIIVADTILRNANGEELSPIPFGGIYLPLQVEPQLCQRSPLILCYDASHFSPLVGMHETSANWLQAIPITYKNRNLLPVHFAVDPGPGFTWWKDGEDHRLANELDAQQTDDHHLELIGRYMDIVKMDLRRGSVKKATPLSQGGESTPSAPIKMLTLAAGAEPPSSNGHGSRILTEIRQHFRWLSRRSKKHKQNRPLFSAEELRQKNSLLCVLLHHFPHDHVPPMLRTFISEARERFEQSKAVPSAPPAKNRMSRSFSSSSVLLTCLNAQCNRIASPSTNFLCASCFEDQKREMVSVGSSNPSPNSTGSQKENKAAVQRRSPSRRKEEFSCAKSITMPEITRPHPMPIYQMSGRGAYAEEMPFRYADESTSASSTVSSRHGARHVPSPTRTAYFYEADEDGGVEDEMLLANRLHRTRIDIDAVPYSRSAPYRYAPIIPIQNGGATRRVQSPVYSAPHSLPRVNGGYRDRYDAYDRREPPHYANRLPNIPVAAVKTCSTGLNRKVSSNGVSFYYAAET